MKIRIYNRTFLFGDSLIYIHRDQCYCSCPNCGATKPHTIGYTIYLWKYRIVVNFDLQKKCNLPF